MFKPLLAATCEDQSKLVYPMYASPKLDGVRAMVIDGQLVSRQLKPIPNKYVRELFGRPEYEGFDGELIFGPATDPKCFNVTTSAVMSRDGSPEVMFHVFDIIVPGVPFKERYADLRNRLHAPDLIINPRIELVEQIVVDGLTMLNWFEAKSVKEGYEGIMLRKPEGIYKFGRSTEREQILLKVKRFADDEAVILDVVEQMHNANEAKKDALGHTERSSSKAGLVPAGILGAIKVRNTKGQEFEIGTGFTLEERTQLWTGRAGLSGRTIKYRYQPAGMKDLPRFPSWVGFRED